MVNSNPCPIHQTIVCRTYYYIKKSGTHFTEELTEVLVGNFVHYMTLSGGLGTTTQSAQQASNIMKKTTPSHEKK